VVQTDRTSLWRGVKRNAFGNAMDRDHLYYNVEIQGYRKVAHIKLQVVINCIAVNIIISPTARWYCSSTNNEQQRHLSCIGQPTSGV
jgi:hypothetical protein